MIAPITSRERPMLNRPSPRKQYEISCSGCPSACSDIVRKSASIWVGCHWSVSPLYTGTSELSASSWTVSCSLPRNWMPSNMRDSTRAVSAADSLWPICEDAGSR